MKKIFLSIFIFSAASLALTASAQGLGGQSYGSSINPLNSTETTIPTGTSPLNNTYYTGPSYAQSQLNAIGYPYSQPATGIAACQTLTTSGFAGVAQCALGILNTIIPIIVAITVVYIIWGAFGLTRSEGEDRKKWRDVILYGIVGLFVMVSIYGLVAILTGTFGLSGGSLPSVQINIPQ